MWDSKLVSEITRTKQLQWQNIAQHQISGTDFRVQTKLTFWQYLTLNVNTCNRESYLNGRCYLLRLYWNYQLLVACYRCAFSRKFFMHLLCVSSFSISLLHLKHNREDASCSFSTGFPNMEDNLAATFCFFEVSPSNKPRIMHRCITRDHMSFIWYKICMEMRFSVRVTRGLVYSSCRFASVARLSPRFLGWKEKINLWHPG